MAKENDVYATPFSLFDRFSRVFRFTCDVCALAENTKVPEKYYTPEMNGLKQQWTGVCWMNPPFSEMELWVEKARISADNGAVVIALLPSHTDTIWYFRHVHKVADVIMPIKGRLRFRKGEFNQKTLKGEKIQSKSIYGAPYGHFIVMWGLQNLAVGNVNTRREWGNDPQK